MTIEVTAKHLAAGGAIFLAIVLALAATIARGTGAGPMNAPALVETMVEEKDHVTAGELARWIIEKRQDYQLIDIRQPWQFDDYHIPTAVNIPLAQLFREDSLKKLSRAKKIVVYGLGAGHSAETQLLLSLKGYSAYSVKEGITAWWDQVLTPLSLRSETQSPAGYQEAKRLREFFMGGKLAGGATATPSAPVPELPAVEQAPSATPPAGGRLKLGRGCS